MNRRVRHSGDLARKKSRSPPKEEGIFPEYFRSSAVGLFRSRLRTGQILDCNDQLAHLFGYANRQECIAEYTREKHHVSPEILEKRLRSIGRRKRIVSDFQAKIRQKGGEERWLSFWSHHDPERGFIDGAAIDITLQKEAEQRIDREIEERKRMEEALRASEEKFAKAFHANVSMMMITGLEDGLVVDVNSACLKLLGYSRDEMIGRNVDELIVWKNPQEWNKAMSDLRAARSYCNREYEFARKRGESGTLLASAEVIELNGKPHVLTSFADITERKRSEEECFAANQRLRALMEALPVGVSFSDDATCDRITGNPAGLAQFEVTSVDNLSASAPDMSAPGRQVRFFKAGRQVLNAELPLQKAVAENTAVPPMELEIALPSGRHWFAQASGSPIRNKQGEVIAGVAVTVDISERKRMEEELQKREERLRFVTTSTEYAVYDCDLVRETVWWNEAYEALFDRPKSSEFSWTWWRDHVHPEDRDRVEKSSIAASKGTADQWRCEYRILRRNGTYAYVLDRALFVRDRDGTAIRMLGAMLDLTDRKQLEEELRAARDAAQGANNAKSQFLANVSHELRTPMSAIMGMTDLALNEALSDEVRDYLETVKNSSESLLALLNELLDFSRIESGKIELESSPFRLGALLHEAVKPLAVRAGKKGLELKIVESEALKELFIGDTLRLRQIITNLVDNAVKFTEKGTIVLRVSRDLLPTDEAKLCFEIEDTGIGIAPQDQKNIFEPFTQADSSTSRRYSGTGLGLTISSNLIRLMKGEIGVMSELGKGSVFHFSVVLKTVQMVSDRGPYYFLGSGSRPLRILLAEDTVANQKFLKIILNRRGHVVSVASDGNEAVRLLSEKDFDVILMDVQMPSLDGFEATKAIRSMPDVRKRTIPIIAMTAHAMKQDEERCLKAGMNSYISKPVSRGNLIDVVERLASRV